MNLALLPKMAELDVTRVIRNVLR